MKKRVLVLGCTGSIGQQTLDILKMFPDSFELAGLTAHSKKDALSQTARDFSCTHYALTGERGFSGDAMQRFIAQSNADIAVNGITGAAGLAPSVYVLENGIDLALANKETIVMAGSFIKEIAKKNNAQLLPVDSEHSAVFNLIRGMGALGATKTLGAMRDNSSFSPIAQIILTASGGPFRNLPKEQFASITARDALKHPTWNMGQKITIDSATLANKGLEVIEACSLFDMPPEKVSVVVHPQSLVHSLIKTRDGVLYAQISKPDMRHPILNALTFPDIVENDLEEFDIASYINGKNGVNNENENNGENVENRTEMTFCAPRFDDFPMLSLAYDAVKNQQCIAYNAANEIAVDAFIHGKIAFTDFAPIVQYTMNQMPQKDLSAAEVARLARECDSADTLAKICALDKTARDIAQKTARDIAQKTARDIAQKTARDIAQKTARDIAHKQARGIAREIGKIEEKITGVTK
ncbi:MAG: 1-deoxy-D-xylulose-5-phosphate reductoisomerase [Treponemataceae bacterium]|nr:MAG: 1-deoxy-D-xylulose-5-phosphate reductoisomerase [Treponemataceae bacterium]